MISHILLNFSTALGSNRAIRVNNPDIAVTSANVRDAMTNMIDSHAVENRSGRIINRRSAFLVQRSVEQIALP